MAYSLEELNRIVDEYNRKNRNVIIRDLETIPEGWNPRVRRSLILPSVTEIPESWCPSVGDFLELNSVTTVPDNWKPNACSLVLNKVTNISAEWDIKLNGDLFMQSLAIIPAGWRPSTGGDMYLDAAKIIPDGFKPTARELYMRSVKSVPADWEPMVNGLWMQGVKDIHVDWNPPRKCSVYFTGLEEIPEGWNPMVDGSLWVSNVTSILHKWCPIVNGELRLTNVTTITNKFKPTVRRTLWMPNLTSPRGWKPIVGDDVRIWFSKSKAKYIQLQDGYCVPNKCVYADGILTPIRSVKTVGGYTVYVGRYKDDNVVSDGTYYAHCASLRDGIVDVMVKRARRNVEPYKEYSLDTELTPDEMMVMYRTITGACRQGTEKFVKSIGNLKDKYTVREVIALTSGQYGSKMFAEFFANNN